MKLQRNNFAPRGSSAIQRASNMHARVLALMVVLVAAQESNNHCTEVTECSGEMVPVRMAQKQHVLWLVWRGAADRVAAALLQRVLAARGFCRIALCEAPRGLCPLVEEPPKEFASSIVVGFETTSRLNCSASRVLDVIGEQRAPLSPRLHAALSRAAAARAACDFAAVQSFYGDKNELHACNFSSPAELPRAYIPPEWRATHDTEAEVVRLLATMKLQRIDCTRDELAAHVRNGKHSFVFVDAEMWADEPRVRVVLSAPVAGAEPNPDTTPALLCSEKVNLMIHAPTLLQMLRQYAPRPRYLRDLLALEADEPAKITRGQAAMRAAAVWVERYMAEFNETITDLHLKPETYRVVVYMCEKNEDPWPLLKPIGKKMIEVTQANLVSVQIETIKPVDCLDREKLRSLVQKLVGEKGAARLLGVAAAGAGVKAASQLATQEGLALIAYDAQPSFVQMGAAYASYLGAGARTSMLAQALLSVVKTCGWRRVVLLSEDTPAAEEVAAALRTPHFLFHEVLLTQDSAELQNTMHTLRSLDARVFVVNAGARGAARALDAGAAQGLTRGERYAWVAREWEWGRKPPLPLLALRSAPRTPQDEGAERMAELWRGPGDWPLYAAPLADAVLTLGLGYGRMLNNTNRFDHRTNETLKLLRHSLLEDGKLGDTVRGLSFDEEGAVQHPIWFELYEANNATAVPYKPGNVPCPVPAVPDGTVNCTLYTGDEFTHRLCLDLLVVVGAPLLLLASLLAAYGEAARRRKMRNRARARERLMRDEACAALLARQRGAVSVLMEWYVERERVRLLSELGTGRHGRVWLAELVPEEGKDKGDAPRFVAAKEPLAGCLPAEESELLREAAALAVLRHEHVTQLVGVCVAGGPPLVLTEHAFFGDLQRYLWARRALASGSDGEAAHVSAEALTRLAREAALALAYLAGRGLVHCDVRAANCLVDERRSLKLADFGMARELGTGEGARDDEYQCRRRKLVPVRWMPPESLTRGVFSPASDVWALGVLALELVSLGERPFGALESPEAVALVRAGGHARLPAHCSRETRWLALACWRREAGARPSARDVAAWLAERPRALAPAPHLQNMRNDDEVDDDDSGFGDELAALQYQPLARDIVFDRTETEA